MTGVFVFLVAFSACGVEMVEAATIVLAMAITRGTRSALVGAGCAIVSLSAALAVLSPLLGTIPLNALRVVVGILGLWFGFNWLRKAVLRASGRKALHDEDAIFQNEVAASKTSSLATGSRLDRVGFVVSFKAVLLEGFEVVVIALAIGSARHNMLIAVLGASAALVVVVAAAVALRAPLSKVPENTLKLGVGVMLVSFGTFWTAEGAGFDWPTGDAFLLAIIAAYAALVLAAIRTLRVAG